MLVGIRVRPGGIHLMRPTFSIILPTCRRPQLLARAVDSVLAQDVADFECIVVDDGGAEPLELPDDPRLRVIRHPHNRGLPIALNTGIDAARGDFVTFLDDDDEMLPDRLSMVLPALGNCDAVVCWVTADGPPHPVNRMLDGRVVDTILDTIAPAKGAVVVRRDRVPRFDPRYRALEDLDWWLRVAATLELTTVPRVGYLVHQHAGVRGTNGPTARVRGGQLLLEEHAEYFRTHRTAAALRWRMIGVTALNLGEHDVARRALARSLWARPTPGTLKRFLRSMVPSRASGSVPDIAAAEPDLAP
jgi:glycosyltransferase involved in cell wall biosynthesis